MAHERCGLFGFGRSEKVSACSTQNVVYNCNWFWGGEIAECEHSPPTVGEREYYLRDGQCAGPYKYMDGISVPTDTLPPYPKNISLNECFKHCEQNKLCNSFVYKHENSECSLKTTADPDKFRKTKDCLKRKGCGSYFRDLSCGLSSVESETQEKYGTILKTDNSFYDELFEMEHDENEC